MNTGILVAGIGNIFLGDDAFGVEVARALCRGDMPDYVRVVDFGIRGFDLALALLDRWETVILIDAVPRGEDPGTLYMIEPHLATIAPRAEEAPDAHSMDPVKVIRLAQAMGEITARILLVGCEPGDCGGDEGRMGLTAAVQRAVAEAVSMVHQLIACSGVAAALPSNR